MSITLRLLPLAIAIARAKSDGGKDDELVLGTRVRDKGLLLAALSQAGIKYRTHGIVVFGESDDLLFGFLQEVGDSYRCIFNKDVDEARAEAIVAEVERAYGKLVQRQVYQRFQSQARKSGLEIEAESTEDDTIVLTVAINE